jgi:hypothetical protein
MGRARRSVVKRRGAVAACLGARGLVRSGEDRAGSGISSVTHYRPLAKRWEIRRYRSGDVRKVGWISFNSKSSAETASQFVHRFALATATNAPGLSLQRTREVMVAGQGLPHLSGLIWRSRWVTSPAVTAKSSHSNVLPGSPDRHRTRRPDRVPGFAGDNQDTELWYHANGVPDGEDR